MICELLQLLHIIIHLDNQITFSMLFLYVTCPSNDPHELGVFTTFERRARKSRENKRKLTILGTMNPSSETTITIHIGFSSFPVLWTCELESRASHVA